MTEIEPKNVRVSERALGRWKAVTKHPDLPWMTLSLETYNKARIMPVLNQMAEQALEKERNRASTLHHASP